jgi:hypothetical protein
LGVSARLRTRINSNVASSDDPSAL